MDIENFRIQKNKKLPVLISSLIIVIILILIINPFYTVETGYVGILSTFGKYNMEEVSPGVHVKIPIAQRILKFDIKVRALSYKGSENTYYNRPAITVLDQRGLPISVEITIQYKPISSMSAEILANWGVDWEFKLLNPLIRSVVRDVIGQYPAELIPVKRAEINGKIGDGIMKRVNNELKINGQIAIQVVGIQLRNIKLPGEIEQKILEVQQAKQEAERAKYLIEKAQNEQRAEKIKAETEKIKKVTQAQADAESTLERAKAQAKANKLLSQSITSQLIKWKSLDVQQTLYESIRQNPNVNLFLGTDNKLNNWFWLNGKKK